MDKQAQETRARLAAVTPPAPCAAFHRETLACMDAGLDLMRGIRNAMAAGDAAALGNLPDRANALKTRSEALKTQETALKHYQWYMYLKPDADDASAVKEKIIQAKLSLRSKIDSPLEKNDGNFNLTR